MKCAINEKTSLAKIPKETQKIHLTRPIKKEKLEEILKNRNIIEISVAESCYKRLPVKTRKMINESNAQLIMDKRRGRALDVSLETMLKIIELRKDYQSIREIEKLTNTPKSTVHYLLKYADRGKIKKGSTIVYLK